MRINTQILYIMIAFLLTVWAVAPMVAQESKPTTEPSTQPVANAEIEIDKALSLGLSAAREHYKNVKPLVFESFDRVDGKWRLVGYRGNREEFGSQFAVIVYDDGTTRVMPGL
jgi:hypothetical protein